MTFSFLKRKHVAQWEKDLLLKIFSMLSEEYSKYSKQILSGLLIKVRFYNTPISNYVGFSYDPSLSKQFEDKNGRFFFIKGIKVFDFNINGYTEFNIYFSSGLISGYSTPNSNQFTPDIEKIKFEKIQESYLDDIDFKKINKLLTEKELKLINPAEVYEVRLKEGTYFHIKDLEDGDFIGMDLEKNIYKITHDPFEIIQLDKKLVEILNTESGRV